MSKWCTTRWHYVHLIRIICNIVVNYNTLHAISELNAFIFWLWFQNRIFKFVRGYIVLNNENTINYQNTYTYISFFWKAKDTHLCLLIKFLITGICFICQVFVFLAHSQFSFSYLFQYLLIARGKYETKRSSGIKDYHLNIE